jgi:hypothetical protein
MIRGILGEQRSSNLFVREQQLIERRERQLTPSVGAFPLSGNPGA